MDEAVATWQPVMILTEQPVLCECGKLAIIMTLIGEDYTAYCQACFEREDEEESEQVL